MLMWFALKHTSLGFERFFVKFELVIIFFLPSSTTNTIITNATTIITTISFTTATKAFPDHVSPNQQNDHKLTGKVKPWDRSQTRTCGKP